MAFVTISSASGITQEQAYTAAIEDAKVAEEGENLTTSWGNCWVTVVPEVKEFIQNCTVSEENLTLRVEQLLGLPPKNESKLLVELWVDPDDLFRPSPDPEIGVSEYVIKKDSEVIIESAANITEYFGTVVGEAIGEENETKMVHVDDIDIAYKTFGVGDPLLMIMGSSGTMDLWPPELLSELASHNQVIIFDNRGMGKTTASDKEFTMELFANDTAGLLDALNISRAHVLGWSMGTFIAQELVLNYPDKVDKVILYAADCGGNEAISPSTEVFEMLCNTSGTPEERGDRLLKLIFPKRWLKEHPDPSTYFPFPTETSSAENIERQNEACEMWKGTYSRLPQITQDTLLIAGTDDVITPAKNAFVIGEQITGAWVVQLRGGGHGVMYQYPEEFSNIVLTFLGI
jgi:pimeloyl-ACP methyl ester carboxylesterase